MLCFREVEDAEHVLFRCPAYESQRSAFLAGSGMSGAVLHGTTEVLQGVRGREEEVWAWMMRPEGMKQAMPFLEQVMNERASLVTW